MRHIISINDFSKQELLRILETVDEVQGLPKEEKERLLKGKRLAYLFYQDSTRTRNSFVNAMMNLGGQTHGFSTIEGTAIKKGENLHDTIQFYQGLGSDVIVLRHPNNGSVRFASDVAKVPIINGGDGSNEHPTQAILDLYTIRETQGKVDGLEVALVGDLLFGRTVHSLAPALSMFNCRLYLVSPELVKMPDYVLDRLTCGFSDHQSLEEVISKADIIYMTRVQKNLFEHDEKDELTPEAEVLYKEVAGTYKLTREMLERFGAKDTMKVLHPLPRDKIIMEVAQDVDNTKWAYYFQQEAKAVPIREGILAYVLEALK